MLDHQSELCRRWAQDKREVTRVYFYGSRVWGIPRTNSDLDVFIVAQPGAGIWDSKAWSNELEMLLSVAVHINDAFTANPDLAGC
jgi:predicted nucleotidyltransferase